MKEIGLGLLGFGTVGAGVVRGLQANGDLIASRLGVKLVLRRIADLDIETDPGVSVADGILTTDARAVIDDPRIDVVIELVGGTGVAKEFVLRALEQGECNTQLRDEGFQDLGDPGICCEATSTRRWPTSSAPGPMRKRC